MKPIKLLIALLLAAGLSPLRAQTDTTVFSLLDLARPGLERVAALHAAGDDTAAAEALLDYYRRRTGVVCPEANLADITITPDEQRWADEAMHHRFFVHKGYQPSYFYGDDIDWRYWPVKDNELRWQLHRHYWFIPLAKCYYTTGDAKYIDAWMDQYTDWVKKNPLDGVERLKAAGASAAEIAAEKENIRFAWRPMEAGRRLQDLLTEFALTIHSPRFTPRFLNLFLRTYRQHADHILHNYSKQGNHLLFEAQRMLFAGIYFPEFREAQEWRRSGIEILNREIGVQVYPDGMQFELDFGYHIAAIDIFLKALGMARANGYEGEFPASYIETVGKMTAVTWNLLFPDWSNPMFGDTKSHDKNSLQRQFRSWSKVFPGDKQLQWFATEGRKGALPDYTSQQFPESGFYVLRTGWDKNATVTVVKAGPPAFWHNQPDNGTFELWHRGRNFFPDSGSYVYAGDKEVTDQRNWFRQTQVHNTLTLDGRNLEHTDSKCLRWETDDATHIVTVGNPSYEGLTHRRTVWFVDRQFFVIADEASGTAEGEVGLHYNLVECDPAEDFAACSAATRFSDGNNLLLKVFGAERMERREGWVSRTYRQRTERPAYAFTVRKRAGKPVRLVTVLLPAEDAAGQRVEAVWRGNRLQVKINGTKYNLK